MILPLTLLLISASVFAQDEVDLSSVKELEATLPVIDYSGHQDDVNRQDQNRRYPHPVKPVSQASIFASGTERGHVKAGVKFIRLEDNKTVEVTEEFYGKFYRLQDEQGFKYIVSNDGKCRYKMKTEYFNSVEPELALYEPPLKYTPAPAQIIHADYDKKLQILPEVSMMVGTVQANFMKDLFNQNSSVTGTSTQFGLHLATDWKLPVKAGFVLHHEKANYDISGGQVNYSATSFGPQFKSKDFDVWGQAFRVQTQFRFSPFAKAEAETPLGHGTFKFNSADVLFGLEHPIKNRLGAFVLGVFYQRQWLSIKDQSEIVSINSSSDSNNSFGLSIAQVFQ